MGENQPDPHPSTERIGKKIGTLSPEELTKSLKA